MKRLLILLFLGFLAACQQEDPLAEKQKELQEKEKELAQLQNEVKTLRTEIAELDTTHVKADATPVSVTQVERDVFEHYTTLTGAVSSRENVLVSAESGGRVLEVTVVEGQKVSEGQLLMRLENDAISNQLSEVKAAHELAEVTFQKRKRLWEQNIGSEIEYLQAKSNYERISNQLGQVQVQYNKTFIRTPISGTVEEVPVNTGEMVAMGTPVARVVDLEKVHVEAEISEEYLSDISRGDTVMVDIPALGVSQKAPVNFVGQVINPENRSFRIKVNLKNASGLIKPNVLANLKIRDYINDTALLVPSIAIKKDLRGNFVFVAESGDEGMIAKKVHVETGRSFENMTEILSGIEEGERVITSGFNQVAQGEPINIK